MDMDSLGKQLGMPRVIVTTIHGKEIDMDLEEAKVLYHELQLVFDEQYIHKFASPQTLPQDKSFMPRQYILTRSNGTEKGD